MHGNVEEWCSDWYDKRYYQQSPDVDPKGPERGFDRVLRGGSWFSVPLGCRSASRGHTSPSSHVFVYGFRAAMSIGTEQATGRVEKSEPTAHGSRVEPRNDAKIELRTGKEAVDYEKREAAKKLMKPAIELLRVNPRARISDSAIVRFVEALTDSELRLEAGRLLIQIGEPAVTPLIEQGLGSENVEARRYAKYILAHIGEPAKQGLMKALSHPNPNVAEGGAGRLAVDSRSGQVQSAYAIYDGHEEENGRSCR